MTESYVIEINLNTPYVSSGPLNQTHTTLDGILASQIFQNYSNLDFNERIKVAHSEIPLEFNKDLDIWLGSQIFFRYDQNTRLDENTVLRNNPQNFIMSELPEHCTREKFNSGNNYPNERIIESKLVKNSINHVCFFFDTQNINGFIRLFSMIDNIGKKARTGNGHITDWTISRVDCDNPISIILNGNLMRPIMDDKFMKNKHQYLSNIRQYGIVDNIAYKPPYTPAHGADLQRCRVPKYNIFVRRRDLLGDLNTNKIYEKKDGIVHGIL